MTVHGIRWLVGLALTVALLGAGVPPPARAEGGAIGLVNGLLAHRPGRPSSPPPSRCPAQLGVPTPPDTPATLPGQPVFPCDFPDPMVLHEPGGAEYYAYATTTAWDHAQQKLPILHSTDLASWTWIGSALTRAPRWASGEVWAPDVVHARGRYYLFYSAKRRGDGRHCVAAATAVRPAGPFHDRGPIACSDSRGHGYIDAAPLVVSRSRAYLYFSVDGPRHSISEVPLTRDLLRSAGSRRELVRVSRPWQRGLASETVEAPFVLRHGGLYYLFYSAGCWCFDYRMGYAISAGPTGPFRDGGTNPILAGSPELFASGGGSLFTGPGGQTELAFQAWTGAPAYHDGGRRTLRIAPVTWNGAAPVTSPSG